MAKKEELLLGVEEKKQAETRDTPNNNQGGERGDGYFDYV